MNAPPNTLQALLGGKPKDVLARDLPRKVVTHDALDDLALGNILEDSVKFRDVTSRAPKVPSGIEAPEPIDITTATPEQITAYQKQAREAKQADAERPDYDGWPDMRDDLYYSLHTHDRPEIIEEVDPGRELHKRVMSMILAQDEHAEARNLTRDDDIAAAIGAMAMSEKLRETCTTELGTQLREQEELEGERGQAGDVQGQIEELVPGGSYPVTPGGSPVPTPEGGVVASIGQGEGEGGQPVKLSKKAQEQLAELESQHQQHRERAEQLASEPTPMGAPALEGIKDAAQAGQNAAEAAKGIPRFGAGLGAGEPTYTSPEQALSIAERWANDPDLRKMAELFGRLDKDIRFKRSKRVTGGNDEIIDVKQGDDLRRTIPAELSLLAGGEAPEDDFLARYTSKELLEYQTVGEENAGRGPILIVLDGSGSMSGERNVWSRAVAMCLLHIARLEKRDFALIEFSSGGQIAEWVFKANEPMPGDKVLDMASHFFGGGTSPIIGVDRATQIMHEAPAFSKADVVLVGDGEAGFGPEDQQLRERLTTLGVRIFGIGIGGSFAYINKYAEPDGYVVDVHDFELSDPSAATAELATHIT